MFLWQMYVICFSFLATSFSVCFERTLILLWNIYLFCSSSWICFSFYFFRTVSLTRYSSSLAWRSSLRFCFFSISCKKRSRKSLSTFFYPTHHLQPFFGNRIEEKKRMLCWDRKEGVSRGVTLSVLYTRIFLFCQWLMILWYCLWLSFLFLLIYSCDLKRNAVFCCKETYLSESIEKCFLFGVREMLTVQCDFLRSQRRRGSFQRRKYAIYRVAFHFLSFLLLSSLWQEQSWFHFFSSRILINVDDYDHYMLYYRL